MALSYLNVFFLLVDLNYGKLSYFFLSFFRRW